MCTNVNAMIAKTGMYLCCLLVSHVRWPRACVLRPLERLARRFSQQGVFLSNRPSPAFRPPPSYVHPEGRPCRGAATRWPQLEAAAPQNRGGEDSANTPVEAVAAAAAAQRLTRARVTVRRAKEADYEGVADIRTVIVPVGMSGATGFLGGKVVIDDPEEAKKRLLMAKVADLVNGETTALIALESGRVVGTIDCATQPGNADITQELTARSSEKKVQKAQQGQQCEVATMATARPQVFLKNMFVLPEYRRRGIARKLVEGAEAFARKERAGVLCLQVDRKNSAARELYYSCGFEDVEPPGPTEGGLGGTLLKALGMGKNFMAKEA